MLTAYDRVLIYTLVLISLLTFLAGSYWAKSFGEGEKRFAIKYGSSIKEYSFGKARALQFGGCQVEVDENRVRVVSSTCPKKICVATGWIDELGESIVCLPHRLVVRIVGSGAGQGFDSVVE